MFKGIRVAIWIILSILQTTELQAQNNTFISARKHLNGLEIETSRGVLMILPYTGSAFQIEFIADGEINPPSYSIDMEPQPIKTKFNNSEDYLELSTSELKVRVNKDPLFLSYFYQGEELFSEELGYFENDSLKGFRFKLNSTEKILGGGSRVLGMNRRGNRLKLYNQASYGYETHAELMYYSLPVAISSRKYMLIFDNGATGYMDLGATSSDILSFEAIGGRMSYLAVASADWRQLAVNYTELTGRQPMGPRWASGNIASRMGYRSQEQVESVVDKYIEENIPLDAIVLDIYWFGPDLKGHMGNLEWDLDSFPQPEQMMKSLKDKGVKTVLITEPFILKNSLKFDEAREKDLYGKDSLGEPYIYDFFFGTTALLDIFKPQTKEWFWELYKKHTLTGVDGWWGDLGEPELHPDNMIHVNGRADHVHNLYGHEWAKLVYEGYARDFPEKRPLILMRSGFVGSQRYGLVPWSGDVNRTWGGLKPQVEISLQMGMQGLAYMHSDLGGFAGEYQDPELYTRWLQYGVFQPVYRTHAQEEVPSEPIYWDEQTKNIVRKYIKLRYALTPYNYTLFYENSISGVPMMRPLFYLEDNDELIDRSTEYLWGDNFLVSPIVKKGTKSQKVYLPKDAVWFNYWTGQKFLGGKEVEVKVTIDNIPVFVRAGAFIPMGMEVQNMSNYTSEKLQLHYYHDETVKNSLGFMYEDDGETPDAYLKEKYEKLNFESDYSESNGLTLSILPEGFNYRGKPTQREVELIVHDFDGKPKRIKLNDQFVKIKDCWNQETGICRVKIRFTGEPVKVIIR